MAAAKVFTPAKTFIIIKRLKYLCIIINDIILAKENWILCIFEIIHRDYCSLIA